MISSFVQNSFQGMNRQLDPSQLPAGQFALLVNGRVRNGSVDPIPLPLELTSNVLPKLANVQGIYGTDTFLFVFANGLAFYRDYNSSATDFTQVSGFQMSPTAPTIYMQQVPASTINYQRFAAIDANNNVLPAGGITLYTSINETPAALVCQDGVSQPWIILPNGSARVLGTYSSWSITVPEYVPIGTLMCFCNNKLYVLCQDANGEMTLICSSVSGQPTNFVVNVANDGSKAGVASTTAYALSYLPITCMSALGNTASANGTGAAFYVSTVRTSYLVSPNYSSTIFGEPTYTNQELFSAGALNQFAVCDLIGNAALVDYAGIRSYNAILTSRFEGKNSPFSMQIQKLFGTQNQNTIIQSVACAYQWDNYGWFAVNTIYGPAILVYDTILQTWVSVDMYPGVGLIAQFADIKTTESTIEFFFRTADNKVYQWGLGTQVAPEGLYVGEFCAATAANNVTSIGTLASSIVGNDLKPYWLNLTFINVVEGGDITLSVFTDGKLKSSFTKELVQNTEQTTQAVQQLPFGNANNQDQIRDLAIDLAPFSAGWKHGFFIQWQFSASLLQAVFNGEVIAIPSGIKNQSSDFVEFQALMQSQTALIPQVMNAN